MPRLFRIPLMQLSATIQTRKNPNFSAGGQIFFPWPLIAWSVPGVLVGAQAGSYLATRFKSQTGGRWALILLFLTLSLVMAAVALLDVYSVSI